MSVGGLFLNQPVQSRFRDGKVSIAKALYGFAVVIVCGDGVSGSRNTCGGYGTQMPESSDSNVHQGWKNMRRHRNEQARLSGGLRYSYAMKAAILAGGLATRLKHLTADTPKALIEVAGKPFLWHQLQLLKRNGVEGAVLLVGHLGERIREYYGD
jgi:hypothetical protein